MRGRRGCSALLAICAALAASTDARANGDPASDVLPIQDVYYGGRLDLRSKPAAQLPALLADARRRGYPIKVALITTFADLGIDTWMWKDPQEYARYLGTELSVIYKDRTLILMGNGYGYLHNGRGPGKERRVLSRLTAPGRPDRFMTSAIEAVRRLAAADGIRLTVPDVQPPSGGVPRIQGQATPVPTAAGGPVIHNTVTPTPTGTAAAGGGGGAPGWLFLAPVGLFALAAGVAMVVSRRRARSSPTSRG
jgi:hypothetical protein